MFPLRPRAIYVTEDVFDSPPSVARMERMMAAMGRSDYRRVDYDELTRLACGQGWTDPRRKGEIRNEPPDPILFTTMKWWTKAKQEAFFSERPKLLTNSWMRAKLAGCFGFDLRAVAPPQPGRSVCQRAWELHTIAGCPYMCDYCGSLSEVIVVGLNIEEFLERMDGWLERCPQQTLFKLDNATDTLCFEPEYGVTQPLIEYFANTDGKYFLLYAGKCAQVEWMLGLDHRGKTLVTFSLAPPMQAREIEKHSDPTDARIAAMRKLQQAGYIVRARFAPIVPLRNWRDEYRCLIQTLFGQVEPDVLSIDTVQRMDAKDAHRCMDLSLWDPAFVEALDMAALDMEGKIFGPLPHEMRAQVYRFIIEEVRRVNERIPIALCIESYEMWQELAGELGGMRPGRYLCNCGPRCTPGTELYEEFAAV